MLPTPRRTPFATPPKAPLRGQGPAPVVAEGDKPDFQALARKRMEAQPTQARVSTPMSGPAPADKGRSPQEQQARSTGTPSVAAKASQDSSVRAQALGQLRTRIDNKQSDAPAYAGSGQAPERAGSGAGLRTMPNVPNMAGSAVKDSAMSADKMASVQQANDALHDKTKPVWGSYWNEQEGAWTKDSEGDGALPPGVDEDTPGVYFDYEENRWTYDPEGGADKSAIDAQLEKALTSDPEDYGMSPELLADNQKKIAQQGAEAKTKLSQQLAGRGLGASGLAGTGFGNIDVGTINAQTDLATQNFQTGVEARINELKTLLTAHGNELSEANRVEIAKEIAAAEKSKTDYEQKSQKEADVWNAATNLLAQAGGSEYAPAAWAWVYDQLSKGKSPADVSKMLTKDGEGIMRLDPKYAPPPPTWDGTAAEWRKLTPAEMDAAWTEWKQNNDFTDTPQEA